MAVRSAVVLAAVSALVLGLASCGEPRTGASVGAGATAIESNDGGVLVKPPDVLEASSESAAEAEPDGSNSSSRPIDTQVRFAWFDGTEASLADLVGTPTVLNFWASNCPPCVAEMPDFEKVHQDLGDRIAFVGMNVADRRQAAQDLAERTGVTYPLASDPDSDVFRSFHGFVMPTTILIDASGDVAYAWAGVLTESELRTLIADNLGDGVDPAPAEPETEGGSS